MRLLNTIHLTKISITCIPSGHPVRWDRIKHIRGSVNPPVLLVVDWWWWTAGGIGGGLLVVLVVDCPASHLRALSVHDDGLLVLG